MLIRYKVKDIYTKSYANKKQGIIVNYIPKSYHKPYTLSEQMEYEQTESRLSNLFNPKTNGIVIITDDSEAIKEANNKNLPVISLTSAIEINIKVDYYLELEQSILDKLNQIQLYLQHHNKYNEKLDLSKNRDYLKSDKAQETINYTQLETEEETIYTQSDMEEETINTTYTQPDAEELINTQLKACLEKEFDIIYLIAGDIYRSHYGLYRIIAETKRLIIREITENDVDDLYDIYDDPEVLKYNDPLATSKSEELDKIKKYRYYMYEFFEYGLWIIEEKTTNRVIGIMGLENRDVDHNIYDISEDTVIELGYIIGKNYRKCGYAVEAGEAILDYAYRRLGIENIYAFINGDNISSQKLAKKLGFKPIKCIKPNLEKNSILLTFLTTLSE